MRIPGQEFDGPITHEFKYDRYKIGEERTPKTELAGGFDTKLKEFI